MLCIIINIRVSLINNNSPKYFYHKYLIKLFLGAKKNQKFVPKIINSASGLYFIQKRSSISTKYVIRNSKEN